MPIERWKTVPGYTNYEASELGSIRNKASGHILRGHKSAKGYLRVWLGPTFKQRSLHRVIVEAWRGKILDGLQINHINGVKTDNRLINLEVCTLQENVAHAVLNKLVPVGEQIRSSRLKAADIVAIRADVKAGKSDVAIARAYSVGRTTIRYIRYGKRWRHIPEVPLGATP